MRISMKGEIITKHDDSCDTNKSDIMKRHFGKKINVYSFSIGTCTEYMTELSISALKKKSAFFFVIGGQCGHWTLHHRLWFSRKSLDVQPAHVQFEFLLLNDTKTLVCKRVKGAKMF